MRDRDEVRERVRKTFKEIIGNPQPKLQNYRQLLVDIDRISNLDDTESAIRETFASLERVGKQKERIDSKRLWSLFISLMMLTLVLTMKSLALSAVFLVIALIAMCIFAKAHKAAFPLNIEIEACKGVLLELHKKKIVSRLEGEGAST
jgi:hypothetical protein